MKSVCTVVELRKSLEMAHLLTKSNVGFAVVAVLSREELVELTGRSIKNLLLMADMAENGGAS